MITRLEERSAAQTARKIEKEFDNVGKTVGQTVGRDLEKGLSEAGAKAGKAAGQSAAKAIAQDKKPFDAAGAAIGDAVSQSFDRSIRGVNLKGFSGFGKAAGTDFSKGFESSLRSLNDRAVDAAASRVISKLSAAGKTSGAAFRTALEAEAKSTSLSMSAIESAAVRQLTSAGRAGGRGFGSAFGSELVMSLPVAGRFASALAGYESVAGKAGAAAGRALGLAFTTAAGGLIGLAGFTLFKGFERYKTIDAARNRLENYNRVLEKTGRQTIDVTRVMETVNEVVEGTRFSLQDAFSVASNALSAPTGDLKRFMSAVANAAEYAGASVGEIGQAFIKVANQTKISAGEIRNELAGIPITQWLADSMGKTTVEINKMISESKIGLEDLLKAVEFGADGLAKGGVNSLEGALEQLNTAVSRLGENLLSAIFGKSTDEANDLTSAVNNLAQRLNGVNKWVTDHRDDIKRYFETAVDAVKALFKALGWVMDRIDDIPGGVNTVVGAFLAWKSISGVTSLIDKLGKINTMLETTIPASAKSAAGKITSALGPVTALLAALEAADWRERLFDFDSDRNVKNRYTRLMEEGKWGELLAGDLWTKVLRPGIMGPEGGPEFPAAPGAPGTPVAPGAGPGAAVALPGGLAPGTNPLDIFAPTAPQGPEADPGAPAGSPILDPSGADDGSGGGGSGPTLPDAPVLPLDTTIPGRIPGMPVTTSILSAEKSYIDARHDLAQKEARVRQLEASGVATAEDIQKAKNDLLKAEMDFQQAEMRLNEARQSEYEQMTKAADTQSKRLKSLAGDLGEIGAKLDDDFGISKGLAGIAENLTKFLANLAAAPLLGQLGAVAASSPSQGGYGLMGVLGAQGVFGPRFTGIDPSSSGSGSTRAVAASPSAMGPAALQPPPTAVPTGQPYGMPAGTAINYGQSDRFPPWVRAIEQAFGVKASTYPGHQESHRNEPGYAPNPSGQNRGIDWSGPVENMQRLADYLSTIPEAMEQVIWQNPITGRSTEIAGGRIQPGYFSGDLAGHQDHVHTRQSRAIPLPGGVIPPPASVPSSSTASTSPVAPSASGYSAPSLSSANIPIPLPVTIVGGLPMGGPIGTPLHAAPGAAPVGTPASGVGLGPLPGPGGPAAGPTTIGGVEPASAPGGGGVGIEGGIAGAGMDAAVTAGSLALDAMAPGAGQAAGQVAQTGMKLANRTIEFGAQAAGIGVQGLMETFLPNAGSELANNNWLTRVVGGIASAAPALPNVAGKSSQPEPALDGSQLDPNTPIHGTAGGRAPGPISIEYHNHQATEDAAGRDLTFHLSSMHSAPGM